MEGKQSLVDLKCYSLQRAGCKVPIMKAVVKLTLSAAFSNFWNSKNVDVLSPATSVNASCTVHIRQLLLLAVQSPQH